jgi:hypothetical protein
MKAPGNSKLEGGGALIQALDARPNRMMRVKSFKAIENAHGCGTAIDSKKHTLDHVITLFLHLEYLNISEISAPSVIGLENWLGGFGIYNRLKRLDASISYTTIFDLLPLFMLPSLQSLKLELEYVYETARPDLYNKQHWKDISSSLTHVSLSNLDVDRFINLRRERDIFDLFQVVGTACPLLRDFEISVTEIHGDQYDHFYQALTCVFWQQLTGSILRSFKLWSSNGCNRLPPRNLPAIISGAWRACNVEILKLDSGFLLRKDRTLVQAALPPTLRQLTVRHRPYRQPLCLKPEQMLAFILDNISLLLSHLEKGGTTPNLETFALELPRSALARAECLCFLEGNGIRASFTDDYVRLEMKYQYHRFCSCVSC